MAPNNMNAQEIFWAAMEISDETSRQRYLDEICADSPELQAEILGMIAAQERMGNFLEAPLFMEQAPILPDAALAEMEPTHLPQRASSNVPPDPLLSRVIGDYEILEQVARGGMGMVYKARQISLNRIVALKMILAGRFAGDEEVQRFHVEAKSAAQLDHPGIVPVFHVGSYQGLPFFAMGYVQGETLAQKLKREPMTPRAVASCLRKIALAVQFAHERGIIHRDLKPANILLDEKGEPKITDFGLAKQTESTQELTATGSVIGTPNYMPPEQAAGKLDQVNERSDVYSIGAMAYAMLTGRPPFSGSSHVETLMQVMSEEPAPPRKLNPGIPADLEAICAKCMEKNPADRYCSAGELAEDLQRFLAGEPIDARNDLARRLRRWSLREPVLAVQLAILSFFMLLILPVNFLIFGLNETSFRWLVEYELILFVWAVAAFVMQKWHNRIASPTLVPLIWASSSPAFLTAIIGFAEPPRELLYSLYLLLLVIMVFFRRVELVIATTVSAFAGYSLLLILFGMPSPRSFSVIFGVVLIGTGALLAIHVLRFTRIVQKDDA
jgi:serine/threonine-protein kinase